MSSPSVGIIGCGKQASKHLKGLDAIGVNAVVADVDRVRAKQLADTFKLHWTTDVHSLIGDARVDAIDVCTPTPTHYDLISNAIAARKPFFVEKPLAASSAEAWKIVSAAKEAGVRGMVGFVYRYATAFEVGHDLLSSHTSAANESALGEPLFALFRIGGRGSHRAWKHRLDDGGGALNEMMVHMLDLMVWYFGPLNEPKLLDHATLVRTRKIDGSLIECDAEDYMLAGFRSDSGLRIVCEADLNSPSFVQYADIQGTNGSFFGSIVPGMQSFYYLQESRSGFSSGRSTITAVEDDLYVQQMSDLVRLASDEHYEPRNSLEQAAHVLDLTMNLRSQVAEKP